MQAALLTLALSLLPQGAQNPPNLRNEGGDARRARLEREVAARVGWKLDETHDYFVLSNVADREVVLELERRANGLRAWLWSVFGPWPTSTCCPGPVSQESWALLTHKCAIRLFASRADYAAAGGSGDSNATYLPSADELLLWAVRGVEGRKHLWRELQASVVTEYFADEWGTGPQAPWFARGMQLACESFGHRNGGADPRPDAKRLARAKELLAGNEFLPLDELLKMPASEFDDSPDLQAELWSFVWFLQRKHRELLRCYVDGWRGKHDVDAATNKAFELVDRTDLEREWRAYVRRWNERATLPGVRRVFAARRTRGAKPKEDGNGEG